MVTPSPAPTPVPAIYGDGYVGRVVVAVTIVALAYLAFELRDVVAIVFGSVVAAVTLRAASEPLQRLTGCNGRVALAIVVLAGLVVAGLGVALLGEPIAAQFNALRSALPRALEAATRWLNSHAIGPMVLEVWNGIKASVEWTRLAGLAGNAFGALGVALLMLLAGLYIAADPLLYRRGALHLLPRRLRARVDTALCAAGHGLSRWLLAQAVAMLAVGVLTAGGLALLGMPLALPLGVIAGLLEFVPFFGTVVSGGLIVLVAFAQGAQQALYAALLCLAVQQFEGYVIQPLAQRWAIALPPALGLVMVIVFGVLFGPLGAVLATPATVVLMVMVRSLYLDEPDPVPPGGGNSDCQSALREDNSSCTSPTSPKRTRRKSTASR
jgi:predicted PurR-regulated permease PerM